MSESFLILCKQNYFNGITPSNKSSYTKEGYKSLVDTARQFFDTGKYDDFAGYFMEGQYLISLWAAHMLVEYGTPSKDLMTAAINTIRDYSTSSLKPDVAEEERVWLKENANKYKEYL